MAWKKIKTIEGHLWVKGNTFVRIFTSSDNQIYLRINKGSLKVGSKPIKTIFERGFINMEEAVKFAENYMREN